MTKREDNFPDMMADFQLAAIGGTDLRMGVTCVVGPSVAKEIKDTTVKFEHTPKALEKMIKVMDEHKVDLRVLLYQGSASKSSELGYPAEAISLAQAYPQYQVILSLSEEDEPPANPTEIKNPRTGAQTLIVSLGHKGKYVGALGVYRTGNPAQPLQYRYELVDLSEEFLTPKEKEANHPIIQLMQKYTEELKRDNYLGQYTQRQHELQAMGAVPNLRKPGDPVYVGSEKCKKCHESAYEVWQKTPHSHAYQTLVDAQHPSLRQYDAECVMCHVTGFGYQGGYKDATSTPNLKDVGCESCHGPASLHVANPTNEEWQHRLNPWRAPENEAAAAKVKRLDRIDQACQRCHDVDNDVTWQNGGFARKWPKIAHPSPKAE
jgi:hypothetical protein